MIKTLATAAALTLASAYTAQAATTFEVEGASVTSTLLTGFFDFDGTTFSDWDLAFTAGSSVTAPFTFNTSISNLVSISSGTGLELESTTSGDGFTLVLEFTDDLDTLAVGDTTSLVEGVANLQTFVINGKQGRTRYPETVCESDAASQRHGRGSLRVRGAVGCSRARGAAADGGRCLDPRANGLAPPGRSRLTPNSSATPRRRENALASSGMSLLPAFQRSTSGASVKTFSAIRSESSRA